MKKNKNSSSDIFSEVLEIIGDLMLRVLEIAVKALLSLFSSAAKSVYDNNETLKSKHFEIKKKTQNFLKQKSNLITEEDLNCRVSTSDLDSLGFSATDYKDFKYTDYDSNVPLSTIIGPPGFGKTNLMLNLIHRDLAMEKPFIVIDPKGSYESTQAFMQMGNASGRKVYVFAKGGKDRFNPLKNLTDTQIVEGIFRAFPNTHEFYGPRSKDHLMDVLQKLRQVGSGIITFKSIYQALDSCMGAIDKKAYKMETQGLKSSLRLLIESDFGELFDDDGSALTIDQIREERACLYVALPTLSSNDLARSIGKIFVVELMNHSYKVVSSDNCKEYAKNNPISFYVDECGDILEKNFKSLASQCRECAVNLTIATQTIADFDDIDKNFLRQLESYQANTWIFRVQNPLDAEHYSKLIGTFTDEKVTKQMEYESKTAMGSWREKESFILHPNLTKKIHKFQAVLVSTYLDSPKIINLRNIDHVLSEVKPKISKIEKPIELTEEVPF